MRTTLLVIGMVGAGLVGAIGGRLLLPEERSAADEDGKGALLAARLAELETEVARLEEIGDRVPWLELELRRLREARPSAESATALSEDPRPMSAPSDGPVPDAASVPGGGFPAIPDEVIEEKVAEVIDARTKAAREAKARGDAALQAEKDDIFLEKLKDRLELTDYQKAELLVHLRRRREAYAEYKRKLTEGGPDLTTVEREHIREELRFFVRQQDDEMRSLLGVERFDLLMKLTSGKNR